MGEKKCHFFKTDLHLYKNYTNSAYNFLPDLGIFQKNFSVQRIFMHHKNSSYLHEIKFEKKKKESQAFIFAKKVLRTNVECN